MKTIWKRVRGWYMPVLLTLIAFLSLKYLIFVGYVPTESMEPTLRAGSYIIGTRLISELQTGDIIIFFHNDQYLVKRIAAGPGEQIDLSQLSYMKNIAIPVWEDTVITVPDGCYFVLGDNSENSIDSRYWPDPFIPESSIVAKVLGHQ